MLSLRSLLCFKIATGPLEILTFAYGLHSCYVTFCALQMKIVFYNLVAQSNIKRQRKSEDLQRESELRIRKFLTETTRDSLSNQNILN